MPFPTVLQLASKEKEKLYPSLVRWFDHLQHATAARGLLPVVPVKLPTLEAFGLIELVVVDGTGAAAAPQAVCVITHRTDE